MLPPFYEMNNFSDCMKQKNTYCIADFQLHPFSETSNNWKKIIEHKKNYLIWDISKIHKGICLPSHKEYNDDFIKNKIVTSVNKNLANYNLTSTIKLLNCLHHKAENSLFNNFVLFAVCFLPIVVILSTLIDFNYLRMPTSLTLLEDKIKIFSLKKNWAKIIKTESNEDFNKLKSIQGYRVILMHAVIFVHATMLVVSGFFSNIAYLEEVLTIPIVQIMSRMTYVLINIFLLISSFLLANKVLNMTKKTGTFTMQDAFTLMQMRYFRIIPAYVAVLCIHLTLLFQKFVGYIGLRFWSLSTKACRRTWLQTVLLTNNYFHLEDLCIPPTWYLSSDFQAYIIIILMFYLIYRFKLNKWIFMTGCLALSIAVYGYVIFNNDLDILIKPTPGSFNIVNGVRSDQYILLYTGLHSTLSVSLLGMIFGAIYNETKTRKIIDINFLSNSIFIMLTWGLPVMAISLTYYEFNQLTRALIGSIVKLIFVSGPGIGILGMAHGFGGLLKKLFENNYLVMISNVSFSVYLSNFLVWGFPGMHAQNLTKFELSVLLYSVAVHWLLSISFGLILALTVELPGANILNLVFSKITKAPKKKTKML